MRKHLFPLISLGILLSTGWMVLADPFLRIVQPFEGYELPPVESSFVFGSVLPATATLSVNGVPVQPHKNGGFLVMVPFEEGKFKIQAIAKTDTSTTTVVRKVFVQEAIKTLPENYGSIKPTSPPYRVVVRPGDTINFSFRAAQNGKANFKIGGRGELFPMIEEEGELRGVYKGIYRIQPGDKFDGSDVIFYLKRKDGKKLSKRVGTKIIVQRRKIARFIETKREAVLLTGPGSSYGYHMFMEEGVRLEVTGEWGDFYRVALSRKNSGWIKKSLAKSLPAGTPAATSVSRNIRVSVTEDSTIMEMPLKHVHPHRIEQFVKPHRLRLKLFGVTPDTDRVRYRSRDSVIEEIIWLQEEPGTATFDIKTTQKQPWGYDLRYEGTTLVLEIRHQPNIEGWGNSLKGLKVAVDAGHTKKSFGTIGPWANTEVSVNVMVSNVIKHELEKRGAEVLMIQDGTKEISLRQRAALAWEEKAHVFLSIHCDATGEGNDPRERQGFSVHYYHPQSRIFAEEIHDLYAQKTGITDQGIWRSNLSVCRMTQMPSVLLELGYLILPEMEELFLTAKFQKTVAETVLSSVLSYLDRAHQ